MKKSHITLLSILLFLIVIISGVFFLKDRNNNQPTEGNLKGVSEENKDKTIIHENGDFVYTPAIEEIGYDNEEKKFYFENLLNIFLDSEISQEEAKGLAKEVDGDVVGKLQGSINMLQIQVEEKSLHKLNQLADHLENDEMVKFAGSSTPSFISDFNNKAQNDSEKIDEMNPDGDNWWAEAINAYSAWYFMDEHKDKFEPVKVAVLESGKLGEEGNDIDDDAINKDNVNIVHNAENAVYKGHAELVTKIIAAKENAKTIRGVAEPFADIEFFSMGDVSEDEILEEMEESMKESKSEAEIIGQLKSSIQEDGVKVINNSWGTPPYSEDQWDTDMQWVKNLFKDKVEQDKAYEAYLDAEAKSNDKVSEQLIIALDEFLKDEETDFLITQSAGNGYSRAKDEDWDQETSLEAKYSGLFTNINKATYDEVEDKVESSLEKILNHIIIVGGAELTEKKDGYQSPEWVSFGEAVDIAAPASELFIDKTAENKDDRGPARGTSFAAPMVSGAAALVWSYNPEMKASEVKTRLLDAAVDHVDENKGDKDTYKMLNMTAFLNEQPYNTSVTETFLKEYPYYNKLIDTYRTAVSEQWEQDELDKKEIGPSHYEPQSLPHDYGYELRDINGNGLPELVLGVYQQDGSAEIQEIYTLKNKKPVKVFENAIRTNVNVYQDGTINTCSSLSAGSMIQCMFYKLGKDGVKQWQAGYEEDMKESTYKSVSDSDKYSDKAKVDIETINEKYKEDDIIEHAFTPFVIDEEETELEDNDIEDIVRKSYGKLEEILLEENINDLYDKYHETEEGQKIWESGVNPNDPFYEDVYELLYPEVKKLVAKEGMESLINEKYSMFWQPPAPISFYGPSGDLEVVSKDSEHFTVKQVKEIGPQDVGGDSYDLIYIIDYVKEDGIWKFAGAKKQE